MVKAFKIKKKIALLNSQLGNNAILHNTLYKTYHHRLPVGVSET